ncbi:MAG: class I SAM-dependent methyltransferase [Chloroflexi bacterium]|nr:class I SAM-dependent methyltransferase [Chloroflexota bacterium]
MSEAELDAARERLRGHDVSLLRERAQSLSLPDRSIDVALSHMAFMLMRPVEPVVAEIARVLAPGGPFSAVIGPARLGSSGGRAEGVTECQTALARAVTETMGGFWEERFPRITRLAVNTPRVMSRASLADLFTPDLGFVPPVTVKDVALVIETSVDGLWDFFAATYNVAFLPGEALQSLESRMKALFTAHREACGTLQFPLPLSRITVHKQG